MAAQTALNARSAAAATLKDTIREITRYKSSGNTSLRLLQNKLDKLVADKVELVAKHYFYAEKANKELDEEELVGWISPKLDGANDLADEIYLMIDELETQSSDQRKLLDDAALEEGKKSEIQVAELQYQADERTLKDRVRVMMLTVNDDTKTSKEDATLVQTNLKQIEESLREQTKSWNTMKSLSLTPEKLNEVFAKQEEVRKHVADRTQLAAAFINNIDPEALVVRRINDSTTSSVLNDSVVSSNSKQLKLEKMRNPTFSGDIRSFARFKSDFETIVAPSYQDKVHQTYVLKQSCLRGDAQKLVENMIDIDEIWERLQARYGDEIEIVNAVIKGIQNFRFVKPDYDRGMINLVDELEKGVQDLNVINAKHQIANAFTVKLLEEKLPRQILTRWLQTEESSTGPNDRFEKMLAFLKQERKHAERMLLLRDQKPEKEPLKDNNRDKKYRQFTAATGGGQKTFNPNNKCLLHPDSSHLTRRCRAFLAKTVEERGKIVKETKGCKLCLSNSHVDKPCPFQSTWGKCDINGCDQHHSRLVHGCQVQGVGCYVEICNNTQNCTNETLLLIEHVNTTSGAGIVAFWDSGSTLALVTKDYAVRNHLHGVPISYDLTTVGGNMTTQNTTLYEITIIDRDGQQHVIKAFEIDEICGELKMIKTDKFARLFPSTSPSDIVRPKGKVEILIGNNYATLHPDKKHTHEGLVLYESKFGTGKILGGSHHEIQEKVEVFRNVPMLM